MQNHKKFFYWVDDIQPTTMQSPVTHKSQEVIKKALMSNY